MRIAITGAAGFIGRRLTRTLTAAGHEILPVTRRARPGMENAVLWDPAAGRIAAQGLEGIDAAVHLAGENVAGLWTAAKKRRIRGSRVQGTTLLSETLARLRRPPATLVSVSGVNYYGARPPDEVVDEDSLPGEGFLASVARDWERATAPAGAAGIRVVHARMGMVVGRGGAIGAMLPLFRLGLGGVVGSGRQPVSWIALDEIAPVVRHVLSMEVLRGPVNFVTPNVVSFAELVAALARVLHRPAPFRVPAFAARLALGQMAEETVLTGVRVVPRRLLETGYVFRYADIGAALLAELGA